MPESIRFGLLTSLGLFIFLMLLVVILFKTKKHTDLLDSLFMIVGLLLLLSLSITFYLGMIVYNF